MGSVYYKFKSQKEPSRVTFDGTGISVFDLKREIMIANKMGKGEDFDLAIYNQTNDEGRIPGSKGANSGAELTTVEFVEDTDIVPRSTSVIVRRIPASKPGRGTAQKYVGGGGPLPAPSWQTNAPRREERPKAATFAPSAAGSVAAKPAAAPGTDQDAIANMFKQSTAQWEQTQEEMAKYVSGRSLTLSHNFSHEYKDHRGGLARNKGPPAPDRPPPPGYVCFRCGQKGHWIQACPTNGDADWDGRPRIKKTTGIPRSFLKTVEQPKNGEANANSAVMVTPEGGFVVATPDSASWNAYMAKTKQLESADVFESKPTDPELECPICHKLIKDATKPPCCMKVYCEDCITDYLDKHHNTCPNCKKKNVSVDSLIADYDIRDKVDAYVKAAVNAGELPTATGTKQFTDNAKRSVSPNTQTGQNGNEANTNKHQKFYHDKDQVNDDSPGTLNYGGGQEKNYPAPEPPNGQYETNYEHLLDQSSYNMPMWGAPNMMMPPAFPMMNPYMQPGMMPYGGWNGYGDANGSIGNYNNGAGDDSAYAGQATRARGYKRSRPSDFVDTGDRNKR